MKPNYLDVAAAIIWQQDRILISQRKTDASDGGLWEFPGGKCHPDETLEACLIREIKEELDILIHVQRPAIRIEHPTAGIMIRLHVFHCQFIAGTPKPLGCADWRWVFTPDLPKYNFMEPDYQIIEMLQK